MIQVNRQQFEALKEAGYIDSDKATKNYAITSRNKKSKRRKYYVLENKKIMNFLKSK